MHKIDTSTAENGAFVDKNVALNKPGTVVDAAWLNAVQNEICNLILAAGITLNRDNNHQMALAIESLTYRKARRTIISYNRATELSTDEAQLGDPFSLKTGDIVDVTGVFFVTAAGSGIVRMKLSIKGTTTDLATVVEVNGESDYNSSSRRLVYKVPEGVDTDKAIFKIEFSNSTHPTISVNVNGYYSKS